MKNFKILLFPKFLKNAATASRSFSDKWLELHLGSRGLLEIIKKLLKKRGVV